MASASKIEWTEFTWNPLVGCTIVSPGCTHCYAMRTAARLSQNPATPHYAGTVKTVNGHPVWTGKVQLAPDRVLTEPLRRKKPTMVFVNSMSDLFHESVPDEWIDRIFAVMALTPQHTYQVLTKRAQRMRDYCKAPATRHRIYSLVCDMVVEDGLADVVLIAPYMDHNCAPPGPRIFLDQWPLPNVWLGVSTERQQEADERIPHLLQTPAAVRFISAEPLLGPIDLMEVIPNPIIYNAVHGMERLLDWVIVGGESGPDARPMHPQWARDLRDQCAAAGVSFFFKQWGAHGPCDMRGFGDAVRPMSKKSAGRLLDGRTHDDMPGRG
jgi:protein gp37